VSVRAVGSFRRAVQVFPGLVLCALLAAAGLLVARAETRLIGHPVVEGLVVVIILGVILRTAWPPPTVFRQGVDFAGSTLLEVAVCLLGAGVDLSLWWRAGPALAAGIVGVVVVSLSASFAIGRWVGLAPELATLVACGNAICGNSAIAAVASVIDADAEHVASAIAFTALLGVLVVICLPLLVGPLHLDDYQFGILAGLTVYSVPQVLATAFSVSALSGHMGTMVKLVRVLLLGPVVLFFALRHRSRNRSAAVHWTRLIPWFTVGFLVLALLRSAGALPAPVISASTVISSSLTMTAMAALGLGVNVRDLARVGRPMVTAVSGSLVVILVLSFLLIRLLGIH
jgi:uncharacterized integral membrane protein (TIGR00698 family)